MKIPSYNKIDAQVAAYLSRSMPSIDWLFPGYNKLETKMVCIRDQFQPRIRQFCEDLRKEKDTEQCFCSLHPDYEKFNELITPVNAELESIRSQWRAERSKMETKYRNILLTAKHAKEKL